MHTALFSAVKRKTVHSGATFITACLLLASVNIVVAAPLAPLPGFKLDAGLSYFNPGLALVGIEVIDPFEPLTTFGFFYESDFSTLISIFDGTDLVGGTPGSQVALVDTVNGAIFDLDAAATPPGPVESTFTPMPGRIGFFITLGGVPIYSDPALNGGLDLFSAWQSEGDPSLWGFAFEGVDSSGALVPVNVTLVGGLVPEPATVTLFALGLLLLGFRARHRRAVFTVLKK